MIQFISAIAIRPAIDQKAYTGDKKKIKQVICENNITDIMKKYIDAILAGQNPNFDKVIEDILDELKNNGIVDFTFGNAQKYVCMVVKYFYITTYNNVALRQNFDYHPAPMDNKMKEHIYDQLKVTTIAQHLINHLSTSNIIKANNLTINKASDIKKIFKTCAWSRITYKTKYVFDIFQECIKGLANYYGTYKIRSSIEYDYLNWQ